MSRERKTTRTTLQLVHIFMRFSRKFLPKLRKISLLISLDVSIFPVAAEFQTRNSWSELAVRHWTMLKYEKLQSFVEVSTDNNFSFSSLPSDASFTQWLTIPLGIYASPKILRFASSINFQADIFNFCYQLFYNFAELFKAVFLFCWPPSRFYVLRVVSFQFLIIAC